MPTISSWLDILELTGQVLLVPSFFESFGKRLVKSQLNAGKRREIYHFRDQKGLEVDFVVPGREGKITLVEAKATRTVRPELARSLVALGVAAGGATPPASFVVHRGSAAGLETRALRPGVKSVPLPELLAALR